MGNGVVHFGKWSSPFCGMEQSILGNEVVHFVEWSSPFCGMEQSILWNGAVHFGKWSSPFCGMEQSILWGAFLHRPFPSAYCHPMSHRLFSRFGLTVLILPFPLVNHFSGSDN